MHALALEIVDLLKKIRSFRIDTLFAQGVEFVAKLELFRFPSMMANWEEASALWVVVDPMGRDWPRSVYRPGHAEYRFAHYRFWLGTLQEAHLAKAESLAAEGKKPLLPPSCLLAPRRMAPGAGRMGPGGRQLPGSRAAGPRAQSHGC